MNNMYRGPKRLSRLRPAALKTRIVSAIRKRRPHLTARRRMRAFGVQKKRHLTLIPLLVLLILLTFWLKAVPTAVARFRPLRIEYANPLTGWAVDAKTDPEKVTVEHSLIYATLSWRELESREGNYDFDGFEARNRLNYWWKEGKRLVLRFVMDEPGEKPHADIPDYLIKRLGGQAGGYYDLEAGQGFCPNYANLTLIERHRAALQKLGERYDGDPRVAFIEIGSLGFNGSWRCEGLVGDIGMPPAAELKTYLRHYLSAFPGTPLVAPAPYQTVKLLGLGLYNDHLGNEKLTWDFLDRVEYGGYDEGAGAELRPMADFYLSAVSGARLDADTNWRRLFAGRSGDFLRSVAASHVTYVSGADPAPEDETVRDGMALAQELMGYRLWVREARWPSATRPGYSVKLEMKLLNDGIAPFSQAWPVELSLLRDDEVLYSCVSDYDLRAALPGESAVSLEMRMPENLTGEFDLAIAILDPATRRPAVALEMSGQRIGLRYLLGKIALR